MTPRNLRRAALDHLEVLSSRAEFHGQPPALMLSFEGLESSLLLANDFWTRLQGAVPGHLVVGVPCRDVVIVTGSMSQAGLEKARRCVERMFFAGGEHLLTRNLLVRRGETWEPFDKPARAGRAARRRPGPPARRRPAAAPVPGAPVLARRAGRRASGPPTPACPAARTGPMPPAAHRPGARRCPMPALPTHTGSMPALCPRTPGRCRAATHTGSIPRFRRHAHGPASDRPHRLPVARGRASGCVAGAAHTDVAQYSAVPYSAMPYSASPTAVPLGRPAVAGAALAGPADVALRRLAVRRGPGGAPSTPRCPTRPCRTPRCRTRPCRTRARPTPSRRGPVAPVTTPTASRSTATT